MGSPRSRAACFRARSASQSARGPLAPRPGNANGLPHASTASVKNRPRQPNPRRLFRDLANGAIFSNLDVESGDFLVTTTARVAYVPLT